MRVVAISDTHCLRPNIPDGDILIHAGDFTLSGFQQETKAAMEWFGSLPHPWKVCIAGNHDWWFYNAGPRLSREFVAKHAGENVIYLQDELAVVGGVRIYGSPWQPWFCNWAFNAHRGPEITKFWDMIDPCDILVTHGPAYARLDRVGGKFDKVGCQDLSLAIARVMPKVHIFGHIHGSYGHLHRDGLDYYNASLVNESYQLTPKQQPHVFNWPLL